MAIYLDHAATTYVSDEVLSEMLPFFSGRFGNPSSLHSFGRDAQKEVDKARERVAKALGCKASEIYFTSGGTESDNWALRGIAYSYKHKGNHIITSKIEHHAISKTCEQLENEGFKVTYIDVDEFGKVDMEKLKAAATNDTLLVSIMTANNEVGTVQPIQEIGKFCKDRGILFHTDAVQAVGSLPIDVKKQNIDLLSLSAHQFYGPKGIGALYVRSGIRINKLIIGGSQERSMRGGTTNVPLAVGMGKAIEIATEEMVKNNEHVLALRNHLMERITEEIPFVKLNGHLTDRLPNNVNFSFEFIESESILVKLDLVGIAVSSGSACTSASLKPSHVLLSMGVKIELSQGSVRFSLGRKNTLEEIDFTVDKLKAIVETLRNMSPLFNAKRGETKHV